MDNKYENLIVERDGKVAVIKINRPKSLNALNTQTLKELECVLFEIGRDKSIFMLIITGEGEKSFVAGADIAEMRDFTPIQAEEFAATGQRVFFMLSEMKIPVIAAVNGYALGGGCELALSADIIYASDKAVFGQPEVKLGVIPGFGGTQRLARRVGLGKAKEMIMSGENVKADEALRISLADRVCPASELMNEAKNLAHKMAAKGRYSMGLAKKTIDSGYGLDIYKGCELEKRAFSSCFSHPDQKEGMSAFVEKRDPKWKE